MPNEQKKIYELNDTSCEVCGNPKTKLVVDPYALEIDGVTEHRYLCNDCLQQLEDDVVEELSYEF